MKKIQFNFIIVIIIWQDTVQFIYYCVLQLSYGEMTDFMQLSSSYSHFFGLILIINLYFCTFIFQQNN